MDENALPSLTSGAICAIMPTIAVMGWCGGGLCTLTSYAFHGSSLKSIIIPDSVKWINNESR
ncbi:MAG: leucine-rich repeat domain-containing protein [Oscillospiraceae bacterium]|nr:leucine-rich repeat domain-containing protein [Oscillospiraceae bacterium]